MPSPNGRAEPEAGPSDEAEDTVNGTVTFRISKRELLSLQIRAFLDASDEVDLTAEVAEDLLQSMPSDDENEETEEEQDGQNEKEEAEDMDGIEITAKDGELVSSISANPADNIWTKQEVRHILHHLKERGSRSFVAEYVVRRNIPIPRLLQAFGFTLCPELSNKPIQTLMYFLEVAMSLQLRKREKLPQYNTVEDAETLIANSKKILVLTGAGISVSCGIPDFRSRDGLYAKLKERGEYDLDDPQQMFDINYFRENPAVFYKHLKSRALCRPINLPVVWAVQFLCKIYPSNFEPSPCHRYIKTIEDQGKLLRNYTQNIDTLESKAGIDRVIQCHGSFATASCLQCRRKVPGKEIESEVLSQRVPLCTVCNAAPPPSAPAKKKPKKTKKPKKGRKEWEESESEDDHLPAALYPAGIMKPDITFFGEKLDDVFEKALEEDRDQVDLLLVIGTSLKVAPVADILSHIPHSVPQILINKTPIRHINPDIILLGDADSVIEFLNRGPNSKKAQGSKRPSSPAEPLPYTQVGESHISLFPGAEGGSWLEEFTQQLSNGMDSPKSDEGGSSQDGSEDGRGKKRQRVR